jgi:hypothetical protein
MEKKIATVSIAACFVFFGSVTNAHIPFVEPEAREDEPAALPAEERAAKDYSFANPFPLGEDRAFQEQNGFAFDGIDSMAINGYLVPGDVDVYRVVPAANEGFVFPAILASVLPPACAEFVEAYPVVALVGPGLPRDPAVLALLPFDVDDEAVVPQPAPGANGVLYAPNPKMERREFFVEDVVTGLSWFLPKGLTQECLEPPGNPFLDCETFANSIVATAQQGMQVGQPYYVAVWDPAGQAQDYTMNLGVTDAHYVDRPEINAEIECFGLIHGGCSQPYPDQPAPEGYFSPLCEKATDAGPDSSPDAGLNSAMNTSPGDSSGCSIGSSGKGSLPVVLLVWLVAFCLRRL